MEGILLMANNAPSNVITSCSQDAVTNALQGIKVYRINSFYSCHKTAFFIIFLYLSQDVLCITVSKNSMYEQRKK